MIDDTQTQTTGPLPETATQAPAAANPTDAVAAPAAATAATGDAPIAFFLSETLKSANITSAAADPAPVEKHGHGILSAALAELGKLEHFTQKEVNALWKAIMERL